MVDYPITQPIALLLVPVINERFGRDVPEKDSTRHRHATEYVTLAGPWPPALMSYPINILYVCNHNEQ